LKMGRIVCPETSVQAYQSTLRNIVYLICIAAESWDHANLQQLQRKEEGKEEDHVKEGGTRLKRI
jgi:hypothetical protein